MNLDVPYERFSTKNTVEYIPLKLALNDLNENTSAAVGGSNVAKNNNNNILGKTNAQINGVGDGSLIANYKYAMDENYGREFKSNETVNVLLITLISIFCVLIVLYIVYAIYFFIILRGRQNTIVVQQENFL
ncbi:AC78 [Trabala vishnou gigantina nucleopolyhedrovirus]|uniref:AC78 n=1 Tax=Trabala vishnou gigantina nucleopolyhedrovirus TaxID=2863583 RepID=UPI002481EA31|nr:AC78 [Trabala vishnou gigantina nucleopolyhedrovirus]QYC92762.1 AC78 [Trabala vishnou gigantina nucleopolyhedrovirus]